MESFSKPYVLGITMISAMGGFLFGYDWVVIGGAKPFYERYFDIVSLANFQGWAMSSAIAGCIIGALFSGYLSEKLGRKLPLLISSLLFLVASIGTGFSMVYSMFIFFRIIGGIGIGLASAIAPVYIAEVTPAPLRGRFVSLNQMTIVIGILAAQIVNLLIAEKIPAGATDEFIRLSWNGQTGWRWMFWACALPSALFLVLLIFLPESPRWLIKAGKPEKTIPVLTKIGGKAYALAEVEAIKSSVSGSAEKVDFGEILKPRYRKVILVGVVIAVFQQWCGINTVFNYAEEIFTSAGYDVNDTMFNIVITGSVNLIMTFFALLMVDRLGRKKLILFGSMGLAVNYLLLGGSYFAGFNGITVLSFIVVAIGIYAMSLAPVTWVILAEIFPNKIRGGAMSIATLALWIACFILTYTFPLINKLLGVSSTFWAFAAVCLAGFFFILKYLPETKNKSLEEIEGLI